MLQTILLDLLTDVALDGRGRRGPAAVLRRASATLVAHLAAHGVDVPTPDGINLWLPVRDEQAAVLHLAAAGIRVAAGSPFLAAGTTGAFVRVTSGLVTPGEAPEVAAALATAARC